MATKKDVPLEAIRGIAAIIVLLWHCLLGFFPAKTGRFPDVWPLEAAWSDKLFWCFFNGSAAVTLFFVLSGFVLTRAFFATGDQSIISRGVVKRWPRLAGPVLLVVMISYLLFKLGLYQFVEAGQITRSPWLSRFAYGLADPATFKPKFSHAFMEGSFKTFFFGNSSYDSSIWTMKSEFIGSFLAFGLALILRPVMIANALTGVALATVAATLCAIQAPQLLPFIAGVVLAAFLPQQRNMAPDWLVAFVVLLVIYLFGYTDDPRGIFGPAASLFHKLPSIYVYVMASILLIAIVELSGGVFRSMLSGSLAAWIGRLSFPVYLVQIPVLCSAGCAVYLFSLSLPSVSANAALIAFIATIVVAFLAAIPIATFNDRWVEFVNAMTKRALSPLASLSRQPAYDAETV